MKRNRIFQVLAVISTSIIMIGCSGGNPEWKFQEACMNNNIKKVKKYAQKIDINGDIARTYFVSAVLNKNNEITSAIIDAGINVNFQTDQGTLLMSAVLFGTDELVKQLIDAGAKVNEKSSSGMTALKLAEMGNKQSKIRILKSNGAW